MDKYQHISPQLEAKIRSTLEFVTDRAQEAHDFRMTMLDKDGIPPPVEVNERESRAWQRALEWVLREADRA